MVGSYSGIPYFWSIALPIVIFDALTIVPIYFISKYFFNNDKAFLTSIIFALAPINFFLPIFIFILPENFLNLYSSIDYVMRILFFIAYILFLYKIHKKNQFQNIFLIKNVLYGLLIFFIFNPIYKYYVAGITPLLILLNKKKRNFIIFEIFNITLLLIPRIFTSYLLIFLFFILHFNQII